MPDPIYISAEDNRIGKAIKIIHDGKDIKEVIVDDFDQDGNRIKYTMEEIEILKPTGIGPKVHEIKKLFGGTITKRIDNENKE